MGGDRVEVGAQLLIGRDGRADLEPLDVPDAERVVAVEVHAPRDRQPAPDLAQSRPNTAFTSEDLPTPEAPTIARLNRP